MRKSFVVLLTIISIVTVLITSCTSTKKNEEAVRLVFEGESKNWLGYYMQEVKEEWSEDKDEKLHYSNTSRYTFKLEYKGEDTASVGEINYEYKMGNGSGSGTRELNEEGKFSISGGGKGVSILRKSDIIEITIKWKDNKETFELTLKEGEE